MTDQLIQTVKADFRKYLYDESLRRLNQCLGELTEDEVWMSPNENTNAMGVLILHLKGNISQYILSGLGGQPDNRRRDEEFSPHTKPDKKELLEGIDQVISEACDIVDSVTPKEMVRAYDVQGFNMQGLSIVTHVIEHCSYHVGQITYFTKMRKNIDTKYYGDMDLNQLNA